MDQLERLKQEEAELEAQMLGNPTEPEAPVAPTEEEELTASTPEELEAAEVMEGIIVPPSSEEDQLDDDELEVSQPQKPKRINWKKRFTNYKTSTDGTINGLRRELIDLKSQMATLAEENHRWRSAKQEVQGDLFEGAFTQEDEDTFGTDGLDVVKKAAKVAIERQVKPLQEELRKQEAQRIQDMQTRAHSDKQMQYDEFLANLGALVPEYQELNKDKNFLSWMSGKDTYGSQVRMDLFRKAEANGDVTRVADFFSEYKSTLEQVKPTSNVPDAVRRHITPVGGGATQAVPKGDADPGYYRKSDIDKFYSDLTKGRYEGQQGVIMATEEAIEQAYRDNRVLHRQ